MRPEISQPENKQAACPGKADGSISFCSSNQQWAWQPDRIDNRTSK